MHVRPQAGLPGRPVSPRGPQPRAQRQALLPVDAELFTSCSRDHRTLLPVSVTIVNILCIGYMLRLDAQDLISPLVSLAARGD